MAGRRGRGRHDALGLPPVVVVARLRREPLRCIAIPVVITSVWVGLLFVRHPSGDPARLDGNAVDRVSAFHLTTRGSLIAARWTVRNRLADVASLP